VAEREVGYGRAGDLEPFGISECGRVVIGGLFIDISTQDVAQALQALGGARVILATATKRRSDQRRHRMIVDGRRVRDRRAQPRTDEHQRLSARRRPPPVLLIAAHRNIRTRLSDIFGTRETRLGTLRELTKLAPVAVIAAALGYSPATIGRHAIASAATYAQYVAAANEPAARRSTAQPRVEPCGLSREVVAFGEAGRRSGSVGVEPCCGHWVTVTLV
jgi:hypothetical protein